VVLDTDTYNEIDDQFALAYLLHSQDVVDPEAIYAAPFHNDRSSSPGDGMEKSFEEIERLLERLDMPDFPHFRGSARTIDANPDEPPESEAVADLVERSKSASREEPLAIIAIGAITNIAAALRTDPSLAERCTVTWLGGNAPGFPRPSEFNLNGDREAARIVFDSGVPLYVVPAWPVSSHLTTTREELSTYLDLEQPLSRFLYDRFAEYGPAEGVWSKEIWDIGAVAWLVVPDAIRSYAGATPLIAPDGTYAVRPERRPCQMAYYINRDTIYSDMFRRLG
jgi:inosine-uridine nucleoside N-ribohydrolase